MVTYIRLQRGTDVMHSKHSPRDVRRVEGCGEVRYVTCGSYRSRGRGTIFGRILGRLNRSCRTVKAYRTMYTILNCYFYKSSDL